MPIGVILGSTPSAARTETSDDFRQAIRELDSHFEAHCVHKKVGYRLRSYRDDFAEDAGLMKRSGDCPTILRQCLL